MEQVYYTQCPMGYGLGASNGYQVKRITPGYPASSDFRHLTLRAFLPGTRTMSPPTLRYRRAGEVAEVAYLTPREREFETEKGLWGRPGGHFAHGLRLDAQELAIVHAWPAGLYGSSIWKRGDPEATRGRMPDDVAIEEASLTTEPTLEAVSRLDHGLGEETLAHLLALTARVARESRTLYVIGTSSRLPAILAVVTFAFPPRLRAELTFSTFHDRPEELPGLRIQGITPESRPNLGQLLGSGLVVDLNQTRDLGTAPPSWASAIARSFTNPTETANRDHQMVCDLVERAQWEGDEVAWTDEWLNALVAFAHRMLHPENRPMSPEDWTAFGGEIAWATSAGLAADLARVFPSSWWDTLPRNGDIAPAREALIHLLASSEILQADDREIWSRSLGSWYRQDEASARHEAIARLWRVIPRGRRTNFVRGLLSGVSSGAARVTLEWVRRIPGIREADIRPLEASIEARSIVEGGEPQVLRSILVQEPSDQALIVATLDAVAEEAVGTGGIEELAHVVGSAYAVGDDSFRSVVEAWAFSNDLGAEIWLAPAISRMFQTVDDPQAWERLRRRLSLSRIARLAPMLMQAALAPLASPKALPWVVERVLLALPDSDRPDDPFWANAYLERITSEIDLLNTLYQPKRAPLKAWIYAARDRGGISSTQIERIQRVRGYTRALQSRDPEMIRQVDLPIIPAQDRGALLAQMMEYLDPSALPLCLERCREVWPGAFEPGSVGLAGLAEPIAEVLAASWGDPAAWTLRLEEILARVGLVSNDLASLNGFEPDGLAAQVLAATNRDRDGQQSCWTLRRFLLRDDRRWRILAADAATCFSTENPTLAVTRFLRWRDQMAPGESIKRFTEVVLNVCTGPAMTAVVQSFASDLKTLGPIPWWRSVEIPSATDDVREAFARMATMGPIANDPLAHIDVWMRQATVRQQTTENTGETDLVPIAVDPEPTTESVAGLSDSARDRWHCIRALSAFHRVGESVPTRLNQLNDWVRGKLPVGNLSDEDLARFLAWLIQGLPAEEIDRVGSGGGWLAIERFASFVARESDINPDVCLEWGQYLPELPSPTDSRHQVARALRRAVNQCRMEARESQSTRQSSDSP